jgi:hypothetical protein
MKWLLVRGQVRAWSTSIDVGAALPVPTKRQQPDGVGLGRAVLAVGIEVQEIEEGIGEEVSLRQGRLSLVIVWVSSS